jgi:hypothetical protein
MLLAGPQASQVGAAGAGPPVWVLPVLIGGVVLCGIILLLVAMRKRGKRPAMAPCNGCGRTIPAAWEKCRFCGVATRELKAELKILSGPLVGRSIDLNREVTTIGTAPDNTVPLSDTGVSRKHVGIKKNDAGYELADLGSTNGVYVNGEKVARRKLEVGDVIRVGTTEMVFRT